jgi:hypothetical protein
MGRIATRHNIPSLAGVAVKWVEYWFWNRSAGRLADAFTATTHLTSESL